MLYKYQACFEGVGKLNYYQVQIHVDSDIKPVAKHTRKVPFRTKNCRRD